METYEKVKEGMKEPLKIKTTSSFPIKLLFLLGGKQRNSPQRHTLEVAFVSPLVVLVVLAVCVVSVSLSVVEQWVGSRVVFFWWDLQWASPWVSTWA
jgi:hypothetical protein